MSRNEKIGIVGSGFIGRSWAMLFAGVGYEVCMYDLKPEQVTAALQDIHKQLKALEKSGLLRGTTSAEDQYKCIRGASTVKECVEGTKHVQESVFENLELKKKVLADIDQFVGPSTVISSSTSSIEPSKLSPHLTHKANFIISHPTNPPYYIPMVEVVPAPWTSKDAVSRTEALMKEIGQSPVMFARELPGFGLNRIQYAILNECHYLVESGVLTAEAVDIIMKDGLGYRYAWLGALETAHLNATGMEEYIQKYGGGIKRVTESFADPPSWKVEDSAVLVKQMDEMVPLNKLGERMRWRDERLAALAKLKAEMKEKEKSG